MRGQRESTAWLGDHAPIRGDGSASVRDRREISARWLSGTVLTGMTSCILMGVALFGAMEGREVLATPPELWNGSGIEHSTVAKADRLLPPPPSRAPISGKRLEVATLQRENKTEVVRMATFAYADLRLAANYSRGVDYPPFDPMQLFAATKMKGEAEPTGEIYGAKVENAVTLRLSDFPLQTASYPAEADLTVDEVETVVRDTGGLLVAEGETQVAALPFVNPQRFGEIDPIKAMLGAIPVNARIVPENVSIAYQDRAGRSSFSESVITAETDTTLGALVLQAGYEGSDATGMTEAIATLLRGDGIGRGSIVRLGLEENDQSGRIVRMSLYDGHEHVLTVARDDRGQYVPAEEPVPTPTLKLAYAAQDDSARLAAIPRPEPRVKLPSAYDAIWQATLGEGLSRDMTRELLRVVSADVDFQGSIKPMDRIAVLYSHPDEDGEASADSVLLHARVIMNGRERDFYRFTTKEGETDFFDSEGRSARQFLLRNPCPNGRFRSGFGMRHHPILGYSRMHTGVDWSAPRGTPIIAAGNGVVQKAGWSGGYGRQTVIRHANGYETSYNHQSAIAKGVKAGARVAQGQIIGYVGSTGLSTGPHLHYEVMVNGSKVDPMRVRLPNGLVLKEDELVRFETEKTRIDAILRQREAQQVAAAATN